MGPNKTPNPMKKQVTIDEGANTMSPPRSLPSPPCPLGGRGGSSTSPQGEAREELGEKLAMVAELVPSNGGRSEISKSFRKSAGKPLIEEGRLWEGRLQKGRLQRERLQEGRFHK